MPYRVIITPEADNDLRTAYSYIRKHAPEAARRWVKDVRQRIKSLAHHPERCALAPESGSFDETIRELLYGRGNRGTYRVLFVVLGEIVYVLHVRHGAMLPLEPDNERLGK